MNLVQCWDQRDGSWDLQVRIELVSSSVVWRERIAIAQDSIEGEQDDGTSSNAANDTSTAAGSVSNAQYASAMAVPVFDYLRTRGWVCSQPIIRNSILRQLWSNLGLPTTSKLKSGPFPEAWTGKEVLIGLLACMGFAWKPDVELLWERDEDEPYDQDAEEEEDFGTEGYFILEKAGQKKRKEFASKASLVHEFNQFVERFDLFSHLRWVCDSMPLDLLSTKQSNLNDIYRRLHQRMRKCGRYWRARLPALSHRSAWIASSISSSHVSCSLLISMALG